MYNVKLPNGYSVEAIPGNKEVNSEFGSYTISVDLKDEENIQYTRTFSLKSGVYPPNKYNDYRNFRKSVAKLEKGKVALVKNN